MRRSSLFTTSWDDGSLLDLRVAEELDHIGFLGTFYATTGPKGSRQIDDAGLKLLSRRHEIGNHGQTHRPFTLLTDQEIIAEAEWGSGEIHRLGGNSRMVAPPKGEINRRVVRVLGKAAFGVRSAPIVGMAKARAGLLEPTFQFYPHGWYKLFRNMAGRRALPSIILLSAWARGGDLRERSIRLLRSASERFPCTHVWGHAKDIERFDLWSALREMLEVAAGLGMTPCTNGQAFDLLGKQR